MAIRIEASSYRIEGFCNLKGWIGEQSVIAFSKLHNNSEWHTTSSMFLPSDIESAKEVVECYRKALEYIK